MSKGRDLENYVSVNERVMDFRSKYAEGAIHTQRETDLRIEVDGEVTIFVRFKALAFRNKDEIELYAKAGVATAAGHAELELGRDKVTEKCESIAVGRALALLGFAADKSLASREEMEEFQEHEERKSSSKKSSFSKKSEEESDDEEESPRARLNSKMKSKAKDDDDEDDTPPVRGSFRSRKAPPADVDQVDGDEGDDEDAPSAPPSRRSSFSAARGKK